MKDNQVWHLVDLPSNGQTIRCKWLFKKKTNMDGNIHTFKARLMEKGFTQTYRGDYRETFSPVADIRAIRILLDRATFYDYKIWQMDVKTTFINGHLSEDIYMVQPKGFVDPKHPTKVCKLQHFICGLKDDTKSQTVYVFVLNGEAMDWKSAKKSTTAISSTEAEYITTAEVSMEARIRKDDSASFACYSMRLNIGYPTV
nr:retrotransposon protein, putative, Ty1-copia subclass [Tanacetum cinerariifolium]GEY73919.1 retrotransposon protein, putative, Ty1-copia subclass [Tanacetum cinerariifolium]